MRSRISSGTAMVGWVSLSWKQFLSAKVSKPSWWVCQRRRTSCRLAEARKYCCRRRSSLPFSDLSFGYRTSEMFSAKFFEATASA